MFHLIQSPHDVPAHVEAGPAGLCRMPSLQVGKWDAEAYLRVDHAGERVCRIEQSDNGVTLTTNRRGHVFRHLDANHFEYDVILPEIPSKPVVALPLEFPRGLSFYKQRPTGRDDLVSGSYAVYWRGRNNYYRTGKLCHIYRPKIIDKAGRWIWGDLDFDGENLVISMNEAWLERARYPVTVDPIIGTSTVGSKHLDESDPNPEEWYDLLYEVIMPVNRYIAPTEIPGSCMAMAHVYAYKNDFDAQSYPVLYSERNSLPSVKLSSAESLINMRSPRGGSEWISGSFQIDAPIAVGTALWFGVMPHYLLYPYYDDGGDIAEMDVWSDSLPPARFIPGRWTPTARILSMYFDYTNHTAYEVGLGEDVGVVDSMGSSRCLKRYQADGITMNEGTTRRCGWRRIQGDEADVQDGLIRRIGRFIRLSDTPVLWDWISRKRMLGLVVRNLVSRITRVLNLESRIGDGEE